MAAKSILIVDDDRAFLQALHVALTAAGYTVAAAADSRAALDYLAGQRHRFDVLITDVRMTGADGLQVLAQARQAFPNLAVIVVSAFGGPDIRAQAARLGAFAYLDKPFSKQQIVALIEQATQEAHHE